MSGTELRRIRQRLGRLLDRPDWSLDRLAMALGADRMTVWRWRHGRTDPQHPAMLERALRDLEREARKNADSEAQETETRDNDG